jgi:hypothetical protein
MAASIMYWPKSQVVEASIIDPHPGLVGWWRFDEGTGNVAKDSSGNGNDGTISGASWVDGKYGKALSFDGASDYVQVSSITSLQITGALTLSAWVKLDSLTGSSAIVAKGWLGEYWWRIEVGGQMLFGHGDNWGNIEEIYSGAAGIVSGEYFHLAVVRNPVTMKLYFYVNGVQLSSPDYTTLTGTSNQPVLIGKDSGGAYLDGIIDEVRIYNRALSATEIGNLFQKGPDFSSRLLAKVPKGTTQFMVTLSWQGYGSINVTIESPFEIYTEDSVPIYQKTTYDSGSGDMLNIKRLAVSVIALSSDENWYVVLEFDDVEDYRISVEVQR